MQEVQRKVSRWSLRQSYVLYPLLVSLSPNLCERPRFDDLPTDDESIAKSAKSFFQIFKSGNKLLIEHLKYSFLPLLISIVLILSGVILAYFDFPEFAQPFHLFFGFAVVCAQVWLLLKFPERNVNSNVSG